ncbi:MAG: transcription antitermination factor NusB [Bacteroidetes bacterium]|nr:transcription antitermination factor NusB [Bacteroidota bacterium]
MMAEPEKITRRELRVKVMQALYAHELSGDPISHLRETILADVREATPDYEYAARMLNAVITRSETLTPWVERHLKNWDLARIAVIDMVLLKMGTAEFLHFPEIPPKVTINEMLDIARAYSTDQSNKFINGILDAVLDDMKKQKVLEKSGRGLIG